MHAHRRPSRRTRIASLALGTGMSAAVLCTAIAPAATSQETTQGTAQGTQSALENASSDELIAQLAELSQRVSAKSEELKQAEDVLAQREAALQEAQAQAQEASASAEEAQGAVTAQRGNVDGIAQSRYRGLNYDPSTAVFGSDSPRDAVDRLGYLGALSKDARKELGSVNENFAAANKAATDARQAVNKAREASRIAAVERARLAYEQEELRKEQAVLQSRIDTLTAQQRQALGSHFGAIVNFDPETLAKLASEGAGGAAAHAALTKQGANYVWGATGPDVFDCSGLMVWSYAQTGKSIPRTSQAQLAGGTPVPLDQLQPGDIIGYYPGVTHVGMYIGNGQVVHASTYGVPVQVVGLNSMPVQGAVRY